MNPQLVVSGDPLRGVSALRESYQEQYNRDFKSEAAVRSFLIQIHSMNLTRVTCMCEPSTVKLLLELRPMFPFQVIPIVPNMDRYSRLFQNHGVGGSGVRLLRELSPIQYPALGLKSLPLLPALRTNDLVALTSVLAHYELLRFKRLKPTVALLHPTVTDLLLANDHYAGLARLLSSVRRWTGVDLGLLTDNLGLLLKMVEDKNLEVTVVAGPLNRYGYRVKPSLAECLERVSHTRLLVIATLISHEAPPGRKELEFIRQAGVTEAIVEIPDAVSAWHLVNGTQSAA